MKIIRPQFEIWPQEPGLKGVYRQVERAGRVCYKSENHQTEVSAEPFVKRMINSQHTAMLEHATLYLQAPEGKLRKYEHEAHSRYTSTGGQDYATTNLRVLVEHGWMDDLSLLVEPTPQHERRVTVHFTTQIAITREYNRHRVNSIAEQSTRYCNYSKDKFGNEITINLPTWVAAEGVGEGDSSQEKLLRLCQAFAANGGKTDGWSDIDLWLFANLSAEYAYMSLIERGHKAQEARVVLPLDTNTELVHTAFVSDWKHFFDLRALGTTGAPHPDAKVLAQPLMEEFRRQGLL